VRMVCSDGRASKGGVAVSMAAMLGVHAALHFVIETDTGPPLVQMHRQRYNGHVHHTQIPQRISDCGLRNAALGSYFGSV
jgi:hypothetical protein